MTPRALLPRSARIWAPLLLVGAAAASCRGGTPPPALEPEVGGDSDAPVLTAAQEMKTFRLPPGYRVELVAAEPLVQDPVAIEFDADGRMWVVEMRGYMPNLEGTGEDRPIGRIKVLEDVDDDGRMDRGTIYLDSLVLPRAIKVMEHGVLVGAPPYLYMTRDTDGDLKADMKVVVRDDYGDPESNPEHQANGLMWGLDNWIHNAKYDAQFRLRPDGTFDYRRTPFLGQWGVSQDDYGRLYRNSNEDPLHADLVPPHYLARNANQTRTRGAYEFLTDNSGPVWPAHPTPGVNRGYREGVLRPDSTLAHFTSAGSPVVYRGDRLPAELRGDVFVTESAGNLVRRFVVTENADGSLSAENAYPDREFLAATHERFRPVNLASAPDGTLYVVDMYRGIIQHRRYITDYLEGEIKARELEQPVGLGRIWRVVHESTRRAKKPQLSRLAPAALVPYLSHPNGWYRDVAQQLLVERGDRSVAPALRQLARTAPEAPARLHALWTLEGLGESDAQTLQGALADSSPFVRAAAVRLSEPWLAQSGQPLQAAVLQLVNDTSPVVRRQIAASAGQLPPAQREAVLAQVVERYGADPIVVDLAVSGLQGRELAFLERLLADGGAREPAWTDAVRTLTATVMKAGNGDDIARMLAWTGEEARPRWQRLALLGGVGRNVPRAAAAGSGFRRVPLPREPAGLLAAAASRDSALSAEGRRVAQLFDWPGKPQEGGRTEVAALTPAQQRLFEQGRRDYAVCAGCHQPNGMGLTGVAKPLVGSRWVLGDPHRLIRIVLQGKEGEQEMPPIGKTLTDEQVAAILTYVRRQWGNQAGPVDPALVRQVRAATADRSRAWTEEELSRIGSE